MSTWHQGIRTREGDALLHASPAGNKGAVYCEAQTQVWVLDKWTDDEQDKSNISVTAFPDPGDRDQQLIPSSGIFIYTSSPQVGKLLGRVSKTRFISMFFDFIIVSFCTSIYTTVCLHQSQDTVREGGGAVTVILLECPKVANKFRRCVRCVACMLLRLGSYSSCFLQSSHSGFCG
jgi:hypothetical protein